MSGFSFASTPSSSFGFLLQENTRKRDQLRQGLANLRARQQELELLTNNNNKQAEQLISRLKLYPALTQPSATRQNLVQALQRAESENKSLVAQQANINKEKQKYKQFGSKLSGMIKSLQALSSTTIAE